MGMGTGLQIRLMWVRILPDSLASSSTGRAAASEAAGSGFDSQGAHAASSKGRTRAFEAQDQGSSPWAAIMPRSSSGPGCCVLSAEIAGSNPARGTSRFSSLGERGAVNSGRGRSDSSSRRGR